MEKDAKVTELLHALHLAHEEIRTLRQANSVLQAKADVIAIFGAALLGRPSGGTMGEDALWHIQKQIREIEARREKDDAS